jgi:type II secretory pathway pseudopilin PulG
MVAPFRIRASGFLLAEMIVSMTILGLIVVGLAISMRGAAGFNRYQWSRQQCIAAGQAQLDSLTATGKPLSDEQIHRLWPNVTVAMERWAGQGQWDGLDRVQVTATAKVGAHRTEIRLTRYVRPIGKVVSGGLSL